MLLLLKLIAVAAIQILVLTILASSSPFKQIPKLLLRRRLPRRLRIAPKRLLRAMARQLPGQIAVHSLAHQAHRKRVPQSVRMTILNTRNPTQILQQRIHRRIPQSLPPIPIRSRHKQRTLGQQLSFPLSSFIQISRDRHHLRPQSGLKGLALMVISDREDERIDRDHDRIARVDVYPGSRVTTLSGAKIGDTEEQIQSLYPGRIQVSPHNYTGYRGGHYLTFVPQDEADRNYRLVFETLKGRVTTFRSGRLPEVGFVEGCA